MTLIEWTHWPGRKGLTWNPWPWIGCTKVSPGCDKCYMYRVAKQFGHSGEFDAEALKVTHKLHYPSTVKEPSVFFVNSMYDTWHSGIPDSARDTIFWEMVKHPQHIFLNLTKRARQMKKYVDARDWLSDADNIWFGVSVENADYLWRIEELHDTLCSNRFISFEPLLGPINSAQLDAHGVKFIDWVITGGESDYKDPRPMNPEWVKTIRDFCIINNTPFFHKQNGGTKKCKCHGSYGCCLLNEKEYREYPKGMVPEK